MDSVFSFDPSLTPLVINPGRSSAYAVLDRRVALQSGDCLNVGGSDERLGHTCWTGIDAERLVDLFLSGLRLDRLAYT